MRERIICDRCAGSGEGMTDGSICHACRGAGELDEDGDDDYEPEGDDYDLG